MFFAGLFIIAKTWKQPKCPWTDGTSFSHEKKKILSLATIWMGFEGIMLSEISQTKTNVVHSHVYMEAKKTELLETESRLVVSSGGGSIGEIGEGG